MRRLLGAVATALLVGSGIAAPPALAQETAVTLRLVEQSPVVLGFHRGTLDLELLAFNGGATTLRNLELVVTFGPRITTQSEYEQMLSTDAPSLIEVSAVGVDEKLLHFEIEPGVPQRMDVRVNVKEMAGIDQTDPQVYPTLIQLKSESTVVATVVTPTIYLPLNLPVRPMLSSTWVQLSAPIAFGADGTLVDNGFPGAIAEGGALRAPLDAIAATTRGAQPEGSFDLVLDPLLITQARDVADGYRLSDGTTVNTDDRSTSDATSFLDKLGRATSHTDTLETIAQPYSDPIVPAMLASGLGSQLAAERGAGATIVNEGLQPALSGVQRASGNVARPRDGRLSDEALDWLAAGSSVVLANDDTVDRTPYQGIYAPAPTVPTAAGPTLVLPDPVTQGLFDRPELFGDPVRGAQVVLGELAVIWKQAPAPVETTTRGVALAPPPTLPPDVWSPLLTRLAEAPFLETVTAQQLADKVNVEGLGYANGEAALAAPDTSSFDEDYAARISDVNRSITTLGSMLPSGDPTPTDLRRELYMSTAPAYQFDPASGSQWLDAVDATTSRAFSAASPANTTGFTLTSTEGEIPIQFGDPGPAPLAITVELRSTGFTFPERNPQSETLDTPGVVMNFPVVAQGSGENQIVVVVRAPNGQEVSATPITVRSTAVNRIALIVTGGAAAGLVGLYARRWFRRRRTTAAS